MSRVKNILLFLVAPVVALVYVVIGPLYGVYLLGKIAMEAVRE